MLKDAIDLAVKWHRPEDRKGRIRGMSLPYIIHPFQVMRLVWSWGAGTDVTMSASMLHDILENTNLTYYELDGVIGEEAAQIVQELTYEGDEDEKKEYMRSFYSASVDALIIKVADRINNVQDFMNTSPDYAQAYFDKADDLFDALMSRLDEIKAEYGKQTVANIVDSYTSVKVSLSMLEEKGEK